MTFRRRRGRTNATLSHDFVPNLQESPQCKHADLGSGFGADEMGCVTAAELTETLVVTRVVINCYTWQDKTAV